MAGNASNWVKATGGPLKGQAVYVPGFGRNVTAMTKPNAYLGSFTDANDYKAFIINGVNTGKFTSWPPKGVAQKGKALPPAPPAPIKPLGVGSPTPSAKPMDLYAANGAIERAMPNFRPELGQQALSAMYAAQGYNAKPDVMTSSQLDGYVKAGETELFRGTMGVGDNPDVWSEALRSGDTHYGGTGMYGHGSYAGSLREATSYATNGYGSTGTVVRMTIKADAKVGDYVTIDKERSQAMNAYMQTPRYQRYDAAARTLATAIATARDKIKKTRSPNVKAAAEAEVASLTKRITKVRLRQQREAGIMLFQDVGAFAVSRGYDAYAVRGTGNWGEVDYHVILNRGAIRVQDTSITP